MKLRTGFVSNSSTSSFLIYGVAVERSEICDLLAAAKEEAEEADEAAADETDDEDEEDDFEDEDEDDEDAYEKAEEAAASVGLDMYWPDGYDHVYIGASWDSVGDDETGRQFKERVRAAIEKLFGKKFADEECGTCEEAYYN